MNSEEAYRNMLKAFEDLVVYISKNYPIKEEEEEKGDDWLEGFFESIEGKKGIVKWK